MSDKLLEPQVRTLARPVGRILLSARFEVQRSAPLRDIFEKYKGKNPEAAKDLAKELEGPLSNLIEGTEQDVRATCQYLSDEYLQIGDALLVISTETGLPIARVREEDMWTPPPVPRSSGNMVEQKPRLRPELEGFLVKWSFDREAEKKTLSELLARMPQTAQDRRLLSVTRTGRKQIVEELEDSLEGVLSAHVGGLSKQLLDYFDYGIPSEEEPGLEQFTGFTAIARFQTFLGDQKARNYHYDIFGSSLAAFGSQWVREVARTISQLAHSLHPTAAISFDDYKPEGDFWIAGDAHTALARLTRYRLLPVMGVEPLVVHGKIGRIVPKSFAIRHREIHDRWEIVAQFEYDLRIDWKAVEALVLTNLPVEEFSGIVV